MNATLLKTLPAIFLKPTKAVKNRRFLQAKLMKPQKPTKSNIFFFYSSYYDSGPLANTNRSEIQQYFNKDKL